MLIHSKMESSSANGPGDRAVIWFQGCTLKCPGCWNPDSHDFNSSNYVHPLDIADWVCGLADIEGVTFSGGEPMQQAPQLYILLHAIKARRSDLTFGMYTGYSLRELEQGKWKWRSEVEDEWKKGTPRLWNEICSMMDFAILGRYNKSLETTEKPLCGSSNQEVKFFTEKYKAEDLNPQVVEFVISQTLTQITGFPVGVDIDRKEES